MIAARVEIAKNGDVRVSAPNAFMDFTSLSDDDRHEIAARLSSGLAQSWPHVQPHPFEFDGRVFRNPGGVAPQLELNSSTQHMTMYVYAGTKPTIRIDMEPVKEFGQ